MPVSSIGPWRQDRPPFPPQTKYSLHFKRNRHHKLMQLHSFSCADLEGEGVRWVRPMQNSNFFKIYHKTPKLFLGSPSTSGKLKLQSDPPPSLKNILDSRMIYYQWGFLSLQLEGSWVTVTGQWTYVNPHFVRMDRTELQSKRNVRIMRMNTNHC